MKRIASYISLAAVALSALSLSAKSPKTPQITPKQKGYETINRITAEGHIGFLAADELAGREAGYPSGRIATAYIEAYFRTLGLEPWNGESYRQPFEAYRKERQKKGRYTVHPDSIALLKKEVHQRLPLTNVMARIEGKNPNEIVVMGAH